MLNLQRHMLVLQELPPKKVLFYWIFLEFNKSVSRYVLSTYYMPGSGMNETGMAFPTLRSDRLQTQNHMNNFFQLFKISVLKENTQQEA